MDSKSEGPKANYKTNSREIDTDQKMITKSCIIESEEPRPKEQIKQDENQNDKEKLNIVKSAKSPSEKVCDLKTEVKSMKSNKEITIDPEKKIDKLKKSLKLNCEIIESELQKIYDLTPVRISKDEINLERQGYRFQRQSIATTKRSFIYKAQGMTSVPVVCKVTVLDNCSPRMKENFLKNSLRIIRYVGGNGREPLHPVFIKVYEIFQVNSKIYQFMNEIGNSNDTVLKLIKNHKKFSQNTARKWFRALCDAVQFLHVRGISHRSIQIEHLLVGNKSEPKLCGWSRAVIYWDYNKKKIIKQNQETKAFENYHMAPESFHGSYNPADTDIWSLGVFLAAIHTKRYIFNVKSKTDFSNQWEAFTKKHYAKINPIVLNLLNSIFMIAPNQRFSLKQILSHEYFTSKEIEIPTKKDETITEQNEDELEGIDKSKTPNVSNQKTSDEEMIPKSVASQDD